jgi:DNA helicase-2/ATP-dependent DNA helicase PcrA
MRQRLTKLLGEQTTSQIKMGTFHALCAHFLRRYGNAIGLERNFTVCDADERQEYLYHHVSLDAYTYSPEARSL